MAAKNCRATGSVAAPSLETAGRTLAMAAALTPSTNCSLMSPMERELDGFPNTFTAPARKASSALADPSWVRELKMMIGIG